MLRRPASAFGPEVREEDTAPRAIKVQRSDLDRWGYTEGCRKREELLQGTSAIPTRGHVTRCRERVLQRTKEDPARAARIGVADKRKADYVLERDSKRAQ